MSDTEPVTREPRPDDAASIIDYLVRLLGEPGIDVITEPAEFDHTAPQEEEWIRALIGEDNSLALVAEADGRIAGLLDCAEGKRKANRHTAVLGISAGKEWRDRGLGRRMMEHALVWARGTGVVKRGRTRSVRPQRAGYPPLQEHGLPHRRQHDQEILQGRRIHRLPYNGCDLRLTRRYSLVAVRNPTPERKGA